MSALAKRARPARPYDAAMRARVASLLKRTGRDWLTPDESAAIAGTCKRTIELWGARDRALITKVMGRHRVCPSRLLAILTGEGAHNGEE